MEQGDGNRFPHYLISFITEVFATAIMVYLGCMGCILGFDLGPLLPSFSFGFSVMMPVQIFNHISPCHMNPAVSLGFLLTGELDWKRFLVYIVAQYTGAFFGYGILKLVTPENDKICLLRLKYGTTAVQGFFLEYTCTFVLIIVVMGASDVKNSAYRDSLVLRLGLAIAGLVFSVESFTSAGLNPARSLPPAVFENYWTDHWLYEVAPLLGMATGAAFYRFVLDVNEKYSLHKYLAKKS